jgi:hypothetical protein
MKANNGAKVIRHNTFSMTIVAIKPMVRNPTMKILI